MRRAAPSMPFNVTVTAKQIAMTAVTTLQAGQVYKIGFDKNGTNYYATGAMVNTYYGAVDQIVANAVDAYVEASGNGWHLYVMIGETKKYVNMTVSGTHLNYTYDATASTVWDYSGGYFKTMNGETEVWAGSTTYDNISIYKESSSQASKNRPLRAFKAE